MGVLCVYFQDHHCSKNESPNDVDISDLAGNLQWRGVLLIVLSGDEQTMC